MSSVRCPAAVCGGYDVKTWFTVCCCKCRGPLWASPRIANEISRRENEQNRQEAVRKRQEDGKVAMTPKTAAQPAEAGAGPEAQVMPSADQKQQQQASADPEQVQLSV